MDIDLPTEKGGPGEAAINAASIKNVDQDGSRESLLWLGSRRLTISNISSD